MNEKYDTLILGTGLKECLLSGLLSVREKKVLHMDRNDYYGGECASLSLEQLFKQFGKGEEPPAELGRNRDWNVDVVPKYILASGRLVKALVNTTVTRYLDFNPVRGSFVTRKGKIHKVPATVSEVVKSKLMGPFEKRRLKKILEFIQMCDPALESTVVKDIDIATKTMAEVFAQFKLEPDTIDFIGHAMGLYLNDDYLQQPAIECVHRIRLYCMSLARFGHSSYIYPMYGLGELPQAFARISAIYGGTYMLCKPIKELLFNEDGSIKGLVSNNDEGEPEEVYCDKLIGDPSYFPDYVRAEGTIVRAICILRAPVSGATESAQIIISQKQLGRANDVYVTVQNPELCTVAKGFYLAFASTRVETDEPEAELDAAFKVMGEGNILHKFITVREFMVPDEEKLQGTNISITTSYDATSHFESTMDDVLKVYEQVMGEPADLDTKMEEPVIDGQE